MGSREVRHSSSLRQLVRRKDLHRAALAALSIAALVCVALIVEKKGLPFRVFVYSALIGLSCFLLGSLSGYVGGKWLERLEPAPRKLVLALIFFLVGTVGWTLATLLAGALSLVPVRFLLPYLKWFLAATGLIGILIGSLFYTFEWMQERLRQSIARLKEHEFAEKELELARSIQSRLLPPSEIRGDGYLLTARNLPARLVAGDFYDVFHLSDGTVGLAVADVSGKGMGASLIMASVKAVLPLLAAGRSAAETVRELNGKLRRELGSREFVALAYGRYNPDRALLELVNAGLPDPYLLRRGEAPFPLLVPGPRLPLGIRSDLAYESLTLTLRISDRVLFLTDGLPEARTAEGEPLGYDALARLLLADSGPPERWLDDLLKRVRLATSESLDDDWTALLLENTGRPFLEEDRAAR